MEDKRINDIDEYIDHWPKEIQKKLKQIRKIIMETVPNAEEKISYRMPMIYLNGVLVYFAAFKNHIGFFPTASAVNKFKSELKEYETTKGTIHLPYDKTIPIELIKKIVKFKAEENGNKIKKKKAQKT
jgi:uncharacterized protein YdhG (YjbR/CyaY superfamily)